MCKIGLIQVACEKELALPRLSPLVVVSVLAASSCRPLDNFALPVCSGGDCFAGDPGADATGDTDADADADTDPGPPPPPEGCSDGTREGYLSIAIYPRIAACAGGFSVPGVTRADLVPTCGRVAGNDSTNAEGAGCSAADLCAQGWRVCQGASEVADRAADGCLQAVPAGAPDKSLLFIVAQASSGGLTCDTSGGDDDVFGCGNLGVALTPGGPCAPLDRALASNVAGSCSFNEAEPPLGPWTCGATADSNLHEGALVSKYGCPQSSCAYNSQPVSNWDKGGVLCCRD